MNIARVLYPVKVLGPGRRIGIWFAGCPRRCTGCSNPELWQRKDEYEIQVADFIELIRPLYENAPMIGFTLTGGEPFHQPKELVAFLQEISKWTDDILVYTGYRKSELESLQDKDVERALTMIGVLIDGPYEEALNNGARLRGSSNQKVWILKDRLKDVYDHYMHEGDNEIQNFTISNGVVSVGIHTPGFKEKLIQGVKKKGVIIHE